MPAKCDVIDWIHLVSVLDTEGAEDAIKEVLRSVASDWHLRSVGLRSGLGSADLQEGNWKKSF